MSTQNDRSPRSGRPSNNAQSGRPAEDNRVEDARDKMRRRRHRVITEEGGAHDATSSGFGGWNEIKFFSPDTEKRVQHWMSGDKKTGRGVTASRPPLVFRMLPGLSTIRPGEQEVESDFTNARMHDGKMDPSVFRAVNIVDRLGSNRTVSFIPFFPCKLTRYPKYGGPTDNPYFKIIDMLEKDVDVPKSWKFLTMSGANIKSAMERKGLTATYPSQLLSSYKTNYFTYAQVYRGFNRKTQKDFSFRDVAYGAVPEHGLQIVSFSAMAGEALAAEYRRSKRSKDRQSNDYDWPDPANMDEGTLNYVWNLADVSPINGLSSKHTIGYTGAVDTFYYPVPEHDTDVDLRISDDFADWYYDAWIKWSDVLHGTYAEEQVHLIARFFPELKAVAKRAWGNCPELMDAWESAFGSVDYDEKYNFFDILVRRFGPRGGDTEVSEEDASISGGTTSTNRRSLMTSGDKVERPESRRSTKVEREDTQEYEEERKPRQRLVEKAATTTRRPSPPAPAQDVEYDEDEYEDEDAAAYSEEGEFDYDENEDEDAVYAEESEEDDNDLPFDGENDDDEYDDGFVGEEEAPPTPPPARPAKKVVKKVVRKKAEPESAPAGGGLRKKLSKHVIDQSVSKKASTKKTARAEDYEDFDVTYDEEDFDD